MNMEIVWTGLTQFNAKSKNLMGHTSLWMFFIYGLAVLIMEPLHNLIADQNWFLRGCVWTSVIFAIEFLTGSILRFFGIEAWYYTGEFSIMGLIRIDYAPVWFAVGLIFERLHSLLISYNVG